MFGSGQDYEEEDGVLGAIGGLLMLVIAPLAAAVIQMAISRAREFGADETGARICGDPKALASALQKLEVWSRQIPMPVNPAVSHLFIVQPLTRFSLENIFSTHPTTEARVERLRRLARNEFRGPAYAGGRW
jgi:heat shock protein HtpX